MATTLQLSVCEWLNNNKCKVLWGPTLYKFTIFTNILKTLQNGHKSLLFLPFVLLLVFFNSSVLISDFFGFHLADLIFFMLILADFCF